MLYAYRIQICSMQIQNTPGATSAWILCSYAQFGALFIALATSWRRQVLLYVHVQNMLRVDQCSLKMLWELL
jgi:hypothetical protein